MKFNNQKVSFGRHATFPLRYSWLTKGYYALKEDAKIFSSDEATVVLGVGKNMVESIRYWLLATKVVENTSQGLNPTKLGQAIFEEDGFDPYLEDESTLWLLHWLLTTNPEIATTFYWFFNRFHKSEFSNQECSMALPEFAKENINNKTSIKTLKQDTSVLLRMYVSTRESSKIPVEEALDSPLSLLKLVTYHSDMKTYQSRPDTRSDLPIGIIGFAITELFNFLHVKDLPIEQLMYSQEGYPAPGAVFRLTENSFLAKLEELIQYIPGKYDLRETAGIHQLYMLDSVNPVAFLEKHYGRN